MKYTIPSIVKEQMKYIPSPGFGKKNGNTAQNKEWIDQVQDLDLSETRVNNNPQHNPENNFMDYAVVNEMYDETVNTMDCRMGYKLKHLDNLEEEYTGQHFTGFYDTVERTDKETGETVVGFLERNNYLDRI
jgi:hypothetical protein